MTRTDAINEMLSAIREAPVSSLDGEDLGVDVAVAEDVLDRIDRLVQSTPWTFNTERKITFTPDSDGLITVGSDVLSIRWDRCLNRNTQEPILRGQGKVYNRATNTFVWAAPVKADLLIRKQPWDSIPEIAQQYIVTRAAREFVLKTTSDQTAYQASAITERDAHRQLKKMYAMESKVNYFHGPGMHELTGGRY